MAESRRDEIAKLEALFSENPEGRVFTHLAEAYRRAGEPDRAREILDRGLVRHPDYSSAHVVLGRVLVDLGRRDEAEQAFRRVLELDPQNLVAMRSLADLAREEGRVEAALGYYRELRSMDPGSPELEEHVRSLESAAESATVSDPGSAGGFELEWDMEPAPGDPEATPGPDIEDAREAGQGWEGGAARDDASEHGPGDSFVANGAWHDAEADAPDEGEDVTRGGPEEEGPGAGIEAGSGIELGSGIEHGSGIEPGSGVSAGDTVELDGETWAESVGREESEPGSEVESTVEAQAQDEEETDRDGAEVPFGGDEGIAAMDTVGSWNLGGVEIEDPEEDGFDGEAADPVSLDLVGIDADAEDAEPDPAGIEPVSDTGAASAEESALPEPEWAAPAEDDPWSAPPDAGEGSGAGDAYESAAEEEPNVEWSPSEPESEWSTSEIDATLSAAADEVAAAPVDELADVVGEAVSDPGPEAVESEPVGTDPAEDSEPEAWPFETSAGVEAGEAEPVEADGYAADPTEAEADSAEWFEADMDVEVADGIEAEADPVEVDRDEPESIEAELVASDPAGREAAGVSEEPDLIDVELEASDPAGAEPADADPEEADPSAEAEPFDGEVVTETLAELYLAQGLNERAVEVYEELLRRRPGDARLEERLREALAGAGRVFESQPVAEEGAGEPAAERAEDGADESVLEEVEAVWTGGGGAVAGDDALYGLDESGEDAVDGGEAPVSEYLRNLLAWRPASKPGAAEPGVGAVGAESMDDVDALFASHPTDSAAPAGARPTDESDAGERGAEEPESQGGSDGDDDDLEMFRAWLQSLKR